MYGAASDWIRTNAPVDVKLDQQLVEEHTNEEREEKPSDEASEAEQSCHNSESKTAVEFSVGCQSETSPSSNPDAASIKSTDSEDIASKVREDVDQELHNSDSPISVTEGSPQTSDTRLSTVESIEVETPVKKMNPSESELPQKSSLESQDGTSSSSDVKLSVDNSEKTLARFTSRPSPPVEPWKGGASCEDREGNESNPEFTSIQHSRASALMNSLSRSSSSGTKLSEAAYHAAVNKLSSDCGWTFPVFDLQTLRQVGG